MAEKNLLLYAAADPDNASANPSVAGSRRTY